MADQTTLGTALARDYLIMSRALNIIRPESAPIRSTLDIDVSVAGNLEIMLGAIDIKGISSESARAAADAVNYNRQHIEDQGVEDLIGRQENIASLYDNLLTLIQGPFDDTSYDKALGAWKALEGATQVSFSIDVGGMYQMNQELFGITEALMDDNVLSAGAVWRYWNKKRDWYRDNGDPNGMQTLMPEDEFVNNLVGGGLWGLIAYQTGYVLNDAYMYDEALDQFQIARKLDRGDHFVKAGEAAAMRGKGDRLQAINLYQEILDFHSTDKEVHRELREMYADEVRENPNVLERLPQEDLRSLRDAQSIDIITSQPAPESRQSAQLYNLGLAACFFRPNEQMERQAHRLSFEIFPNKSAALELTKIHAGQMTR